MAEVQIDAGCKRFGGREVAEVRRWPNSSMSVSCQSCHDGPSPFVNTSGGGKEIEWGDSGVVVAREVHFPVRRTRLIYCWLLVRDDSINGH